MSTPSSDSLLKETKEVSGLEINSDNYIDIQVEWRDPYNKKKFDSLADVAGKMIDIHYNDMKKKINRKEDHTLWEFCPLPEKLIKYAAMHSQHMSHGESSTMS